MDGSSQTAAALEAAEARGPRISARTFAIFQGWFWGAFLVIRGLASAVHFPTIFFSYMGPRVLLVICYAGATTGVHLLAARFQNWSPQQRLTLALITCAAAILPVYVIEAELSRPYTTPPNPWQSSFVEYFAQFGWIFFAWSGFYFALDLLGEARVREAALARERAKATTAQFMMLRYQLNPHFLFNSLNAISTLVLEGRNADAERMILGLSRFLRHTIDTDVSQLSALKDEIKAQCLYLEIEAARFGERLTIQCDMEDNLGDCLVPSLLLQPVVENAIKHGVAHNPQRGWIRIASEHGAGRLKFIIEDNGPGPPGDGFQDSGVGLRNSRERLRAIYGGDASLTLTRRPQGGSRAVFDLPLKRAI